MKKAFVIVGPTAVGKTSAAIRLAQEFNTEIISADSRQCYRELNIGVARPTPGELAAVPHHFIASHSILEPLNAGQFEQQSLQKAREIFAYRDVLVVVGGTGLYIKAFCEGLDEIPSTDPDTRQQVIHGYETRGMDWLREQVSEKDPEFFGKGETKNPQRLMRALEVVLSTGRSIFSFRNQEKKQRDFEIVKLGLQLPKEKLVENISVRTDEMISEGLVDESKTLLPFRELGPLQTVGYAEMFDYIDGKTSLEKAIELIKIHTWQYAKRQYTWFRKDREIQWMGEIKIEHG
jgi:tRNA dimethylallyltransferase